jgi:hypothetical protein
VSLKNGKKIRCRCLSLVHHKPALGAICSQKLLLKNTLKNSKKRENTFKASKTAFKTHNNCFGYLVSKTQIKCKITALKRLKKGIATQFPLKLPLLK